MKWVAAVVFFFGCDPRVVTIDDSRLRMIQNQAIDAGPCVVPVCKFNGPRLDKGEDHGR